jgi:hypothetical protein
MHPVTAWYLAEAKHDDLMRDLARPRLPRPERRERHGLFGRVNARLHRRPASGAGATAPAGCGLPVGCAA